MTYNEFEGFVKEYLEEIDSLIDADDGDVFTWPFIEKHEKLKEIVYNGTTE